MATKPTPPPFCLAGCGKDLNQYHHHDGICTACYLGELPPQSGRCRMCKADTPHNILSENRGYCAACEISLPKGQSACPSCYNEFPVRTLMNNGGLCGHCTEEGMTKLIECPGCKKSSPQIHLTVNKGFCGICRDSAALNAVRLNCATCLEGFPLAYLTQRGGECDKCKDRANQKVTMVPCRGCACKYPRVQLTMHDGFCENCWVQNVNEEVALSKMRCPKCNREATVRDLIHNAGACSACQSSPKKVIYNRLFDAHHARMCRIATQLEILSQQLDLEMDALEMEGGKDSDLYKDIDQKSITLFKMARDISFNYDIAEPRVTRPTGVPAHPVTGRDMSKIAPLSHDDK